MGYIYTHIWEIYISGRYIHTHMGDIYIYVYIYIYITYIYNIFLKQSSVDGHLGSFHVSAMVNNCCYEHWGAYTLSN